MDKELSFWLYSCTVLQFSFLENTTANDEGEALQMLEEIVKKKALTTCMTRMKNYEAIDFMTECSEFSFLYVPV